ncbi:uncharacterized protein LOC131882695 isoform X2 [Tigriopus californicus]|uniref:uncharacterized protein LOC131882695 isoform X2 n=1 Tax=Tigriopus californicus TaxID=6832 RepID=UPI0027DA24CC|nr:uncharacterized protein LOC131882695 isoform X2 [Tigriopus californicus]
MSVKAGALKVSFWITLLFGNLIATGQSDPVSDIAAIKELLEVIFHRHRSEMEDLKLRVLSGEAKIEALQEDFSLRIFRIEQTLSRQVREASTHIQPSEDDQPRAVYGDLEARLAKLEGLTKYKAPRTCDELKRNGLKMSGMYYLDPDGPSQGHSATLAFCDMTKGETRMDHNLGGSHRVSSCQEFGCSVHRIQYEMSVSQISKLISLSSQCFQEIQYDCLGAPLSSGSTNYAWWTGRHGNTFTTWHGNGSQPISGCQCGATQTCFETDFQCNCDANNGTIWLQDRGKLTDKSSLPVMQLNFGAVDARKGKVAKFQLGPLKCFGNVMDENGSFRTDPSSCQDLWNQGITQVGYYMVRSRKDRYPKVVFCDMTIDTNQTGFERVFGSPGNLRYFEAFDVSLNQPFYDDFRYINFTTANMNSGGHFNIRDGIYTVPYTGTYLFSIHGLPLKRRPFKLQIHKNGVSVAGLSNGESEFHSRQIHGGSDGCIGYCSRRYDPSIQLRRRYLR